MSSRSPIWENILFGLGVPLLIYCWWQKCKKIEKCQDKIHEISDVLKDMERDLK